MIDGKISLILPAHNEEANIGPVATSAAEVLPQYFRDYEVIIVDDGSQDKTHQVAAQVSQANPHIIVVRHPHNRGYGAALTSGFQAASGDYWMFMDSDRQFDIGEVSLLVPYAETHDIVAGYRIKRSDPLHRIIYGRAFTMAVKVMFGTKLRDIDCGFKLFKARILRGMTLESPGALINTEIMAKANRQGAKVAEVGVHHYPRVEGEQSGGSLKVVTRAFKETMKLWWRMRNYTPPGYEPSSSPIKKVATPLVVMASALGIWSLLRAIRGHGKKGRI